jgi:single-strand DNA-binding protein
MNQLQLIGNLGADPELRYTTAGLAVCTLRIATHEWIRTAGGERETHTEWHRAVAFGKGAETLANHARKGAKLFLAGPLRSREYAHEGQRQRVAELRVREFELLEPKAVGGTDAPALASAPSLEPDDDDPPF